MGILPLGRCESWSRDLSHCDELSNMVSRRKILSQSRDELSYVQEEEEDVWYTKDKLYKDHIQEVRDKWESIDDEIWAKIVVLERNRRVAKAYARAPVVTVNGTDQGFKLKMDDLGNILIKRLSKSPVYAKNTSEENAVSNEIIKLQNGLLDYEKPPQLPPRDNGIYGAIWSIAGSGSSGSSGNGNTRNRSNSLPSHPF